MTLPAMLILLAVIGLPVAWVIAEFRWKRPARITLGVLAILCSFGVASIIGMLSELRYNAWYGSVTKDLIDTTVHQIEDGQFDRVMTVLRSLNRQYHPTYENRANYRDLVGDATARMKGDVAISNGGTWDAPPFEHATWVGHWENDAGFWIVINDVGRAFDIIRSGYPRMTMETVSLSEDCRTLTFHEGSRCRHTLTLINKYEADHEWFDLEKQSVWHTDHLHKLIRPTPEQRKMTQQAESTEPVEAAPSASSTVR